MTFTVTDQDIRRALKGSYTHNPVSHAIRSTLKRKYGRELKIEIYSLDYGFIDGRIFVLPHQCRVLLHKFHGGERVQPIAFDLELPEDII